MINRQFKIVFFAVFTVLFSCVQGLTTELVDDKQAMVAMRMIGHKFLASNGDTDSQVLPIERNEDMYILRFGTEFTYEADTLKAIVDQVMLDAKITSNYVVEMVDTKTEEVIYSYLINKDEVNDMIPCSGRDQPFSKYRLQITFLEKISIGQAISSPNSIALNDLPGSEPKSNIASYFMFLIPILLLIGLIFYFKKNKRKPEFDPNVLLIGGSKFDKRNMELSYENRKIELTNKETDLLLLLLNSANEPLTRENILKNVWGDEGDYIGRTLDVFISKLRKKLESDTSVKIVNIRGVGYKLVVNS